MDTFMDMFIMNLSSNWKQSIKFDAWSSLTQRYNVYKKYKTIFLIHCKFRMFYIMNSFQSIVKKSNPKRSNPKKFVETMYLRRWLYQVTWIKARNPDVVLLCKRKSNKELDLHGYIEQ